MLKLNIIFMALHCWNKGLRALFVSAMKGEIINCSAHKDIYFLETNPKPEVNAINKSAINYLMFVYQCF